MHATTFASRCRWQVLRRCDLIKLFIPFDAGDNSTMARANSEHHHSCWHIELPQQYGNIFSTLSSNALPCKSPSNAEERRFISLSSAGCLKNSTAALSVSDINVAQAEVLRHPKLIAAPKEELRNGRDGQEGKAQMANACPSPVSPVGLPAFTRHRPNKIQCEFELGEGRGHVLIPALHGEEKSSPIASALLSPLCATEINSELGVRNMSDDRFVPSPNMQYRQMLDDGPSGEYQWLQRLDA